jgi:hypothetical protein
MRSSMTATMLSMIGMITNSPAPRTLWSFPSRRITNFCQTLAIFSDIEMITAAATNTRPAGTLLKRKAVAAARTMQTRLKKLEIGFIVVCPWGLRLAGRA